MFIRFDADRPSDSPYIERVWRCHSEGGGPFLAVASSHWEFVVTQLQGDTTVTLHGPESRAREVYCPPEGQWLAIRFRAGTFMPAHPVYKILNGNDVSLPGAFRGRFRLDGSAWELPTYDNAETFVSALAHRGILQRDAGVAAALEGDDSALSRRQCPAALSPCHWHESQRAAPDRPRASRHSTAARRHDTRLTLRSRRATSTRLTSPDRCAASSASHPRASRARNGSCRFCTRPDPPSPPSIPAQHGDSE